MEGLLEGSKGRLEEFVESLETEADAYARVKARLQALQELLADTECASTRELLACAEDTRALLADWDSVAGARLPCAAQVMLQYLGKSKKCNTCTCSFGLKGIMVWDGVLVQCLLR